MPLELKLEEIERMKFKMSKKKSVFVTAMCAAMLLVIATGAMLLEPVVFEIIVGVLAFYGLYKGIVWFYWWLREPSKPSSDASDDTEEEHVSEEPVEYWNGNNFEVAKDSDAFYDPADHEAELDAIMEEMKAQ